ncbi:MAG: 50S ribosome-binding GTPase [Hyphomonadaceae bacterium]|nr:50S ribosome-binding GTPase [Clostridia bacterium]
MENAREVLKMVVVGHVDHGKSTVIGRLLYDTNSLPEGAIDRVKRISKEKGKPFEYAYLLDAFEEEQKQGITIDTTQLQFHTEKRDYVIIDAPGHKEFLKNMISGAASAEAALLIIDANEGIQEQSKRHGYILSLLGIQKVYVIVNKMDLIDYQQHKFENIQTEMNIFLNGLGVYPLKYIPISAFYGDNLARKSENMAWYKGESILEAMDLFEKDKGLEQKPLRFPIQDVYKFDNRRIIAGRIESGTLKVGDEILISPGNKITKVKTIEYWVDKDQKDVVEAGMSVGITVEDEFFNKRGEFISHKQSAPLSSKLFKANLFWMGKQPLVKGKKYKLKLTTQEIECEVADIHSVIDASSLAANSGALEIKINDVAEITLKTKESVVYDLFKHNQGTGRFVLVDGYDVCGGGIISAKLTEKKNADQLQKNDLSITVHCFDAYYYAIPEGAVRRYQKNPTIYTIGSVLPIQSDTYAYPSTFDLVDAKSGVVALVRDRVLSDIVLLENYQYNGLPLLEKNGFAFVVTSQQAFVDYINDANAVDKQDISKRVGLSNKWLDFTKYRTIKFIEYPIANDWNI